MKRLAALVIAAACLLPATAFAETIIGPSGKPLNIAKCNRDSMKCLSEAGRKCGGPYQVIDSESHAGGLFADILPGPVTWYSMVYRCGRSDGRMPRFPHRGPDYQPPHGASCTVIGHSVFCFGS